LLSWSIVCNISEVSLCPASIESQSTTWARLLIDIAIITFYLSWHRWERKRYNGYWVHYRTSIFLQVGRWRSHCEIFISMHAAVKIKFTPWNSRIDCSLVTLFAIWYYGWLSHKLSILVISPRLSISLEIGLIENIIY